MYIIRNIIHDNFMFTIYFFHCKIRNKNYLFQSQNLGNCYAEYLKVSMSH